MSISEAVLGRGDLVVSANGANFFQFRYDIRESGIRCYSDPRSDAFRALFDVIGDAAAATAQRGSHLVLIGLPASPADAFRNITLAYTPAAFTLSVANPGPFGARQNLSLKDLRLDFSFRRNARRLQVAGRVTLVLLDREIPLRAQLTASGLVFRVDADVPALSLAPLANVPLGGLELGAQYDRWAGLQALYAFAEKDQQSSRETSGPSRSDFPDPLDLTFDHPGSLPPRDVLIGEDGLAGLPGEIPNASPDIRTKVISGKRNDDGSLSAQPAGKITRASLQTNEITMAAWLTPAASSQAGPAVIASIGKDGQNRFFTLGHGASTGQPAAAYDVRLRTSETGPDGLPLEVALDPAGATPTYLVYTRNASGQCAFFLNGTRQSSGAIPGDLDWNDDFGLILLNEFTGDRPWAGVLRRLEFYNRAIGDDEARLNYSAQVAIQTSGALTAAGAFDFNTAAHPNSPLFTGQIQLREETRAAQGNQKVAFLLTGRLDLFPTSSAVQAGADCTVIIDSAGVIQCRERATVTLNGFTMVDPFLEISAAGVTLSGAWLGQQVVFTGRDDASGFVLESTVDFDVPFTPTVGPTMDPSSGAFVTGEVTLHHIHATAQVDLGASGFTAHINVSFQWTDDAGVDRTEHAREFNVLSAPPTRNELFERVIAELKAQSAGILASNLVHGEDYYFLPPVQAQPPGPDPAAGVFYLGNGPAALKTHIVSTLPKLYVAAPATPAASQKGIFTLTQGATSCTLTIDVGTHSSADIESDYRDFLTRLETPSATLLPGGAQIVKARIAERLPMTLDQVLFFHYGFVHLGGTQPQNFLDLQAGMRLRVDYQNYQLTHPSDAAALDGFVGSGTCYYQLSGYAQPSLNGAPLRLLGFDAFLSNIQSTVTTDVGAVGAGGILDFQREGFRRPYFRLFYPSSFAGPGVQGFAGVERLATIVGANTLTELKTSTNTYLASQGSDPGGLPGSFFFRGRAAVIPEICIFVQESPHYVPVGATVRQIIERFAGIPTAGRGDDLNSFRGRLRPRRLLHEGVNSEPVYKFIDLNNYRFFTGTSLDVFDLPVVKGDRFYL